MKSLGNGFGTKKVSKFLGSKGPKTHESKIIIEGGIERGRNSIYPIGMF